MVIDINHYVYYSSRMINVYRTNIFQEWLIGLKDTKARERILKRIRAVQYGHFGDAKSLGGDLHELRFHFGNGYRVYYCTTKDTVIFLLNGGVKDRQTRDIQQARKLMQEIEK